jgi:hypothetical protein
MKVTTGLDAANIIPGNNVADALADLQVTVRANPGFAIVCVSADAGLSYVVDSAFCFAPSKTKANRV